MLNRISQIYALTLLLVVAHLHCLCHADVQPLSPSAASQQKQLPLYPDRHCDNEYGCICKGATLVAAIDCQAPLLHPECMPLPLQELDFRSIAVVEMGHRPYDSLAAPMPTGRILRAHLSSLVI